MNLLLRTFSALVVIFASLLVAGCRDENVTHSDGHYTAYDYKPYVYEEGPNQDVYQYYSWGYTVYQYRDGKLEQKTFVYDCGCYRR